MIYAFGAFQSAKIIARSRLERPSLRGSVRQFIGLRSRRPFDVRYRV